MTTAAEPTYIPGMDDFDGPPDPGQTVAQSTDTGPTGGEAAGVGSRRGSHTSGNVVLMYELVPNDNGMVEHLWTAR